MRKGLIIVYLFINNSQTTQGISDLIESCGFARCVLGSNVSIFSADEKDPLVFRQITALQTGLRRSGVCFDLECQDLMDKTQRNVRWFRNLIHGDVDVSFTQRMDLPQVEPIVHLKAVKEILALPEERQLQALRELKESVEPDVRPIRDCSLHYLKSLSDLNPKSPTEGAESITKGFLPDDFRGFKLGKFNDLNCTPVNEKSLKIIEYRNSNVTIEVLRDLVHDRFLIVKRGGFAKSAPFLNWNECLWGIELMLEELTKQAA